MAVNFSYIPTFIYPCGAILRLIRLTPRKQKNSAADRLQRRFIAVPLCLDVTINTLSVFILGRAFSTSHKTSLLDTLNASDTSKSTQGITKAQPGSSQAHFLSSGLGAHSTEPSVWQAPHLLCKSVLDRTLLFTALRGIKFISYIGISIARVGEKANRS